MASVELVNISKSYGAVEVIAGLSLAIGDGSFTVFVGPSGCGKSTLLRMVAGLEPITDGEVRIGGRRVNDADPIDRGVAMVFQNYALYPHMTVEQNIGFSLKMAGLSKQKIAEHVAAAARTLQVEELLKRKPAHSPAANANASPSGAPSCASPRFSCSTSRSPTSMPSSAYSMRVEIAKLHRHIGATMIYVTHDQTEAMTLAENIVVLRNGKIEQVGTPEVLYEDPANLFVAGFIGSPRMNFLRATATESGLALDAGPVIPLKAPREAK